MKITNGKAMVAKMLVAGCLAGVIVMATPAKASAQEFFVRAGCAPRFEQPVRFDRDRDLRRHDEWRSGPAQFRAPQDRGEHNRMRHGERGADYR